MIYLFLVIVLNILIRWLVSLNEYSGYNKPPMYGDFEAQRHWMEITYNLPIDEWYRNTSSNDLLYWGLDYPPLTAYHSFLLGHYSKKIEPKWVELGLSHGITNKEQKLFMRYTVLIADLLLYFTAVTFYWYLYSKESKTNWITIVFLNLLYPGLILIDHGHFQYNCISLGLFIWALIFIKMDYISLAAVVFSLSLNYKQMELYHALPIFAYLLGYCLKDFISNGSQKSKLHSTFISNDDLGNAKRIETTKTQHGWLLLIKISVATAVTFLICWYPFVWDMKTFKSVIARLFPFNRGLYEDKVANFWCTISIVVKIKSIFQQNQLVIISLLLTLAGSMPSFLKCLFNPNLEVLKLALVNTSLAFFLFSFQVHEKTILLVAIPMLLLLPEYPYSCLNFLLISCVSMYPLFAKDNLQLPFYAMTLAYFAILTQEWLNFFANSAYTNHRDTLSKHKKLLYKISAGMGMGLCLCCHLISPPLKYPDLWAVVICGYAFVHFIYYLVYFNYQLFTSECNWSSRKKIA